ncbi:unnamed protein product [Prunus armeniaca]
MVQEGLLQTVEYVDGAGVQPVEPIQGRRAEGGKEEEAHAFVTKAMASEGRSEEMDMGERILRASVEGDTEWLNVLLLVVIEDTFGKGPKSWLRPEGLVAAVLLTLQTPNFLEEKPHDWVGMTEGLGRPSPLRLLQRINGDKNMVLLTVQEMVSAISVDLHRFMGLVIRQGDVKKPRLDSLWMEMAFTLAEPRLD